MGLGKRLRRLDDSTGVGDWASGRLEFWAPVFLLGTALLVGAILFAAARQDWGLVLFLSFGLVLVGVRAFVGTTLWLRRNRGEDKWRDPW